MKKQEEVKLKEQNPLKWPEGWHRTLLNNRQNNAKWRLTFHDYMRLLDKELARMDVTHAMLTRNVGPIESRDPGVALYFSRHIEQDFSWQEILGITDPNPSMEMIDRAFREKSKIYHTDVLNGGDKEAFILLNDARQAARRWIQPKDNFQYVIANDKWKEPRWNIQAIRITLEGFRKIEEAGSSGVLERVYSGFQQIAEHSEVPNVHKAGA